MKVCILFLAGFIVLVEIPLIWRVGGIAEQWKWLTNDNSRRGVLSVTALIVAVALSCFAYHASAERIEAENVAKEYRKVIEYGRVERRPHGVWLPHLYLDAGWTYNSKGSPQCEPDDPDNEIASDLAAVLGIYSYRTGGFWFNRVDFDYKIRRHGSGFICEDSEFVYDDHGPLVRLYIWSK